VTGAGCMMNKGDATPRLAALHGRAALRPPAPRVGLDVVSERPLCLIMAPPPSALEWLKPWPIHWP